MTICIATIAEAQNGLPRIVFAADRELTYSGNGLTFEQGQPKADIIHASCFVMFAGDISLADIVVKRVKKVINNQYCTVQEAAELFRKELLAVREELVDIAIFKPRGLTLKSFYEHVSKYPEWFVIEIDDEVNDFQIEGVEFLVFGIDLAKNFQGQDVGEPHIYQISNTLFQCLDRVGFGIIGSGIVQSLPEITKEPYSPTNSVADAVVRTFWAKKSAERIAGVGKNTTDFGVLYVDVDGQGKLTINNGLIAPAVEQVLCKAFEEQIKLLKLTRDSLTSEVHKIFTGTKRKNAAEGQRD